MKKTLCAALAACLLCAGASAAAPARDCRGRFADVSPDAWYADAVEAACAHGLMEGRAANTFAPEENISFAEVIVLTARLHSLSHGGDGAFPAGEAFYSGAADYLVRQGVLAEDVLALQLGSLGADDPFGAARIIDQPANRGYAADLLAQALPAAQLAPINDVDVIPDFPQTLFADESVWRHTLSLYRAGVLTGNDAWGTFALADKLTRAEAAALAARLAEPALRKTFTPRAMPFTLTRLDAEALGVSSAYPLGFGLYGASAVSADGEAAYGILDARGRLILPAAHRYIEPFYAVHDGYGYACDAETGDAVLFDETGKRTARLSAQGGTPLPDTGANADHGYFRFYREENGARRWGLVDYTGATVLPAEFQSVRALTEKRLAAARTQTADTAQPLYALYDETGKALTDAAYLTLEDAGEGLFLAQTAEGRFGYLDADGRAAVPFTLARAGGFSAGLAPVTDADGACYYLTPTGAPRLREACARYRAAGGFAEGFALVESEAGYGLINPQGQEIIPASQPTAPRRVGDRIAVPGDAGVRYFTLDGAPAPAAAWANPFELTFSEGYAYGAAEGGGAAYFTPDGAQVTPAMFAPRVTSADGALRDGAAIVKLSGLGAYFLLSVN